MPPNTARPFTRKEFEQFVENGGEEALCVACETREKIKSDITKIQSDSNLSLSQKQAAIKAKQDHNQSQIRSNQFKPNQDNQMKSNPIQLN